MFVAALLTLLLIAPASTQAASADAQPPAQLHDDKAAEGAEFDLVLTGGRVMDPESRFDEVRNIGIRDGRIVAVSEASLTGAATLDAAGLIVAPGFIDLASQAQSAAGDARAALDGVTTALDLSVGANPIGDWIVRRRADARIHFGAASSHFAARLAIVRGKPVPHPPTHRAAKLGSTRGPWGAGFRVDGGLGGEDVNPLLALLMQGINEGAIGIAVNFEHAPQLSADELLGTMRLAAARAVPLFVRLNTTDGQPTEPHATLQAVLAMAEETGTSLHLTDSRATGGTASAAGTDEYFARIREARSRGVDVTADIAGSATDALVHAAMVEPGVVIASGWNPLADTANTSDTDASPNPLAPGPFTRALGAYAKGRGNVSLMDALRKVSLLPARRIELTTPQMARKGRIRVGGDADLTIFEITDGNEGSSAGATSHAQVTVVHVIVGGEFAVQGRRLVEDARLGRSVRGVAAR